MMMPESMDDCFFFTNRTTEKGSIKAWVFKPICPKCKKNRIGKPLGKTGKVDKKAETYACACGYSVPIEEADKSIKVDVIYTCPFCQHKGETQAPYMRQKWQGVPSYIFECQGCGQKIGITKKLKAPKK